MGYELKACEAVPPARKYEPMESEEEAVVREFAAGGLEVAFVELPAGDEKEAAGRFYVAAKRVGGVVTNKRGSRMFLSRGEAPERPMDIRVWSRP